MTPKIKICGIRFPREAQWISEAGADYAGFVFFEKSHRNVTPEAAREAMKALSPSVKTVAVTVSPTADDIRRLQEIGVDIIQAHGDLPDEVARAADIPLWRAVNIGGAGETADSGMVTRFGESVKALPGNVAAVVLDGASYGGGKAFDWEMAAGLKAALEDRALVLAGGLNESNVSRGIELFSPDVVDVSSGVEKDDKSGKDRDKIVSFIRKVKENE